MILPLSFFSVCFLISASVGSEQSCHPLEDECETINVQRYIEKCHKKDVQLLRCKTDYSQLQERHLDLQYAQISKYQHHNLDLERRYSEVLSQLSDEKDKCALLHSKQQEVDNLINQKNKEIEFLKDQIMELKEESWTPGEVSTHQLANIYNQMTSKTQTINFQNPPCPRNRNVGLLIRDMRVPGSDPIKVAVMSDPGVGFHWLHVYRKQPYSKLFNRTYEDYERGFGDIETYWDDEFFIGLNQLHRLTSGKPHEVLLWNYSGRSICDHFVVGDQSEGYMVKSIGNCTRPSVWMSLEQGTKFSTFDRDEDGVPGRNLAEESGYGWWFDPSISPELYAIDLYIRKTD